jgi:hypothetical protein
MAVTENKRLGEVLTWIKAQQSEVRPAPKIKTNSEQTGYKKRGTKVGSRTDFMNDPAVIARREQALARFGCRRVKRPSKLRPGSSLVHAPIELRNPDQLTPDRALSSAPRRRLHRRCNIYILQGTTSPCPCIVVSLTC